MPAVNKRLRFEILRRDQFRCYYCGVRGNETECGLTIDHVVPVSLGGSNAPENLVSACGNCNFGKGAASLESETVSEVAAVDARRAEHKADAVSSAAEAIERGRAYVETVIEAWRASAPSYAKLPPDADARISSWFDEGIPDALIAHAFTVAWARRHVPTAAKFRYATGVVRRLLEEAGRP